MSPRESGRCDAGVLLRQMGSVKQAANDGENKDSRIERGTGPGGRECLSVSLNERGRRRVDEMNFLASRPVNYCRRDT